jgi:hypothetical protein
VEQRTTIRGAVEEAIEERAAPASPQPLAAGPGPSLVQVGTIGATAINVDVSFLYPATLTRVLLSQPYSITRPPGYPSRPSMTGTSAQSLDFARTIAAGVTLTLLKVEADAIIAAGGGTYA